MRLDFDELHHFWIQHDPPHPMLPVRLANGSRTLDTYAMLDSGADACLFHAKWGQQIGLHIESGIWRPLSGIEEDSEIDTWSHPIELRIGNRYTVKCNVRFAYEMGDDLIDQLIGREVVFDKFRFALRQGAGNGKLYVGGKP